ncbi:L,D-transpeptidase-like protein [Desulfosoma caldarium]|uniref:L,D-transpeptidase-like protein n=2 Tax=Desulfosoma caldarium TaxID=610254 RepID=A0A3N1VJR1_9BACT|nr:L,D-transpeptidase-like protein [Desulfosoma caldarium]
MKRSLRVGRLRCTEAKRHGSWMLWLWLAMVAAGCTFQSPSPQGQLESTSAQEVDKTAQERSRPFEDLKPVRIDYLRPTEEVRSAELYIYKDKRRLYVMDGDVLVRNYPIGLGKNPKGDKKCEGDGRTPEGSFFICFKNPRSRFFKSLALSYPSQRHAEQAFAAGLISPTQYRDIILALDRLLQPPWDTPLGGGIYIHGGGAHGDWTDGCIALYNSDMSEIYQMARLGTRVEVRP